MRFLAVVAICCCYCVQLDAQIFSARIFSDEEGLQQKFIFSIDQDSNGVLLLGTEAGPIAYNGDYFASATTSGGLAEKQISTLLCDTRGVVWTGHFQSGISSITRGITSIVDSTEQVRGRVHSMSEDAAGDIWGISDGHGLFRIDHFTRKIEIVPGGELPAGKLLVCDNRLLVASESGLRVYEVLKDRTVHLKYVLPETQGRKGTALTIGKIFSHDILFVACENEGVLCYEITEQGFDFKGVLDASMLAAASSVTDIKCDKNSTLWIGTMGNGVTSVRFGPTVVPDHVERFDERNGLIDNNVQSLFVDVENNLWIGTFGAGLVELPYTVFRYYTINNGLLRNEVNCVAKDKYGELWLGTDKGITRFGNSVKSLQYDSRNKFQDSRITALEFDTAGLLWVGTEAEGVFTFNRVTEQFVNVSSRFKLSSENISGIVATEDGLVYVGTTDGLYVFHSASEKPAYYTTLNGLAHNNITQLHADTGNNIWFASEGSPPYVMSSGRIDIVNDLMNMQAYVINAICEDRSNKRWLTTDGDGVFAFTMKPDGSSRLAEHYSMLHGLKSDHCIGAIVDKFGMLWVAHKSGVSLKFPGDSFFYSFGNVDNALFSELNGNILQDQAGAIYFCSAKGLIEVTPVSREYLRNDPHISLAALFIDGSERNPQNNIELGPGSYNLTFEFNNILLSASEKETFWYRILGADTIWRSGSGRSIVIPQLSSGMYILQVQPSRRALFRGTPPLNVVISIDYPFWQKTWFIIGLIFIVPVIIYSIIRLRTLSLVRLNQRLHVLVKEKTFLLETEKESVARINVELQQKSKDITDSIQYAKRIQMAILPDVDILNKNLPESFVFYQPRDIVSGDFYWFAERDNLFFLAVADCTGHGVPGAFMSMISSTLINKVVFDLMLTRPSVILQSLDSEIKSSLHQQESSESSHDGMDIALCVIDKSTGVLRFSGAGRPLLHVHDGKVQVHKTNRGGLGGIYNKSMPVFDEVRIELQKGDSFYMYSDGYTDQFGGAHEHKFSSPAFRGLIERISPLPMSDQGEELRNAFAAWKGNSYQCDDVLVVGFRV